MTTGKAPLQSGRVLRRGVPGTFPATPNERPGESPWWKTGSRTALPASLPIPAPSAGLLTGRNGSCSIAVPTPGRRCRQPRDQGRTRQPRFPPHPRGLDSQAKPRSRETAGPIVQRRPCSVPGGRQARRLPYSSFRRSIDEAYRRRPRGPSPTASAGARWPSLAKILGVSPR